MRRFIPTLVFIALTAVGRAAPPVEFEGFGLGNFEGTGSIAGDLERIEAAQQRVAAARANNPASQVMAAE